MKDHCKVEICYLRKISFFFFLTVIYSEEKREIQIQCPVQGYPQITWLKDNKSIPIVNGDRYELQCLNGWNRLIIRDVQADDSNLYTCRLEYPAHDIEPIELNYDLHFDGQRMIGKDALKRDSSLMKLKSEISSTNYYRDFKRKPIFSTLLTDRSAAEGSTVRLTATAIGVDCNVVWMKNNRVLETGSKYKSSFNSDSGMAILEVCDVQAEDSGEYSCVVANGFGENESTARLKIYEGFAKAPMPVTFTRTIRGNKNWRKCLNFFFWLHLSLSQLHVSFMFPLT